MIKRTLWLLIIGLLIAGCRGTVQIGIEQTPPSDDALTATLEALVAENHYLATQVAAQVAAIPSSLDLGQLAYVQGGDIWVMTLLNESSRPLRLTTDGHNLAPRWSSSGRWLAFRKERPLSSAESVIATPGFSVSVLQRQVGLIQADGSGEHLLSQGASIAVFAWSPREDRLVYTTAAGGLSTVNADGTDSVTLIPESSSPPLGERQIGRVSWSPDGNWIAYELRIQPAGRFLAYQGLWMVSPNGGTHIELHNSGAPNRGECILVGWSSLGTQVLFLQNQSPRPSLAEGGQLYAVRADPDSSPQTSTSLISGQTILPYNDFVAPSPFGTAGSSQPVVAFIAGDGRDTWNNKNLWSAGQRITADDLAAISPTWSPDGSRLAFVGMPAQSGGTPAGLAGLARRRVWVANAYGDARLRQLTDADGYRDEFPRWSADGDYLLFARIDTRGRASLWIISSNGGFPRQVVDELTPAPDPLDSYGHVDWDAYFDWWRGM